MSICLEIGEFQIQRYNIWIYYKKYDSQIIFFKERVFILNTPYMLTCYLYAFTSSC